MEVISMKVFATVMKILAVLAVIAGIVYVVATFGDRIVEWAKNLWLKIRFCNCCDDDCCCEGAVQASDVDFEA